MSDPLRKFATDRQWEYWKLSKEGISHSRIAALLNVDRRAVDRAINRMLGKAVTGGYILAEPTSLKILYLDIETAPIRSWIWAMWQKVTSTKQLDRDWFIMSYAYKWYGQKEVYVKTLNQCEDYRAGSQDDIELISDLHALLSEADIVIAHNGDNFDIKKIKTRMVMLGMRPPTPFRTVDTLKICKREFRFTSNRLDYVAQELLGENKLENSGLELWFDCMLGKEEAWVSMMDYNSMDVELLEKVYLRIRPWDRGHPNMALTTDVQSRACTVCASTDLTEVEGAYVYTNASKFSLWTCNDCGHHVRGRKSVLTRKRREVSLATAR